MNGKPQEARKDEQEDILDQIITQGLDKMRAAAQATASKEPPADEAPPAPKPADGSDPTPPAGRKNRRSAVYLYLLILFGAAFLMLLLAYFIQQRSSEDTISDLRDSMNLSREELLDEIRDLKAQNEELNEELDRLNSDLDQWQERYEEKDGELTDLENLLYDTQEKVYSWSSFWELERYYQEKDYESCAAALILQGMSEYTYRTPDAALKRYEEIVRAVIDAGILEEDYAQHPDDYNDLLDAYFAERLLFGGEGDHDPTGGANTEYHYDAISRFT